MPMHSLLQIECQEIQFILFLETFATLRWQQIIRIIYITLFNIWGKMQSELQKKRNIFRASLRRQFIQSFQRSIRQKYLQRERQQMLEKIISETKQNLENILANLDEILAMTAEDICTNDNFQYFIEVIEGVVTKKNIPQSSLSFKNNSITQYSQPRNSNNQFSRNNPNLNFNQNHRNFPHFQYGIPEYKNLKISGGWVHKQRIYSLLYRILQKSFGETKGRLWYVIDKVLYLLQFPQLMPLWERLSSINDLKSKNYCSNQFSKKLTKNSFINYNSQRSHSSFNSILDPEFVLDILTNFIVQNPSIQFQNSLQLIPFINYALNINIGSSEGEKQTVSCMGEQSYPKLNKLCIILRSILKQDSMKRLAKLVENGCEDILLFLFDETSKLFCCRAKKQYRKEQIIDQMDEEKSYQSFSSSPLSNKLQCGYLNNSKLQNSNLIHKQPANLIIITKTNLVKLINRLFVANPHVSIFLYLKTQRVKLFNSLLNSFTYNQCNSEHQSTHFSSLFNPFERSTQTPAYSNQQKYQFIILCDSHRTLLKNILSTLNTILISGPASGHSFIDQFLQSEGIFFLEKSLLFENMEQYSKELTNIIQSLDAQGNIFYNKLNTQAFKRYLNVIIEFFRILGSQFIFNLKGVKKDFNLLSESTAFGFIQIRWCLSRLLKIMRNSILIAYARATQPSIFEEVADNIIYSYEYKDILLSLSSSEKNNSSEDQQIKFYSTHILQICSDPKQYLQKQKNYSVNRQ